MSIAIHLHGTNAAQPLIVNCNFGALVGGTLPQVTSRASLAAEYE